MDSKSAQSSTSNDAAVENDLLDTGTRQSIGLDILYTKVSVDFQNLTQEGADTTVRQSLEGLRESTCVDSVCLGLLDPKGLYVEKISVSTGMFATSRPERLKDMDLEKMPWFRKGLGHLRLLEIADTNKVRKEAVADAAILREMGIGSILVTGFSVGQKPAGFIAMCMSRPQESWDVNLRLLLKLVSASFASGLARLRAEQDLKDFQERNDLATFAANDGMWDFDVRSNSVYFSPRWKTMLGYGQDELNDSVPDWRNLVHPDDMARVQGKIREHLEGKTDIFESMHRMRHRDGEWRWVLSRAKALPDANGRLKRLVGVELDITERKLYEEALFREKERAQITLRSIGDGVVTTDAACLVEYLNPVAEELSGWKLDDAVGRPVDEIFRGFHEETCEPLENPLSVAIRRQRPIKSVRPTLLIRRDGNELYIESTASPIQDGKGKVSGGVLVFHDVSEARELNRRLSYHASHDILTGLVNRREFENRLERALKSAKAREASYAICYLDLDQFKIVNDSCGHAAGDTLLAQLGALLKAKIRWRDSLARLGGDEFGVLLESCSLDEAMRTADVLRQAVQDFRFVWDDRTFRLSASIGVVPISLETTTLQVF